MVSANLACSTLKNYQPVLVCLRNCLFDFRLDLSNGLAQYALNYPTICISIHGKSPDHQSAPDIVISDIEISPIKVKIGKVQLYGKFAKFIVSLVLIIKHHLGEKLVGGAFMHYF